MGATTAKKTDRQGYDNVYGGRGTHSANSREEYVCQYTKRRLTPFNMAARHLGGEVRGLAVRRLTEAADSLGKPHGEITILDAGSGLGELSVYLACQGYNVIGVEVSAVGCAKAQALASELDVSRNCRFLTESLEQMSIEAGSIDFIVGFGTLHHFIKYDGVPAEFRRIMKDHAMGFFADPFSENPIYHLFRNKKQMERLGDVPIKKKLITDYFDGFEVEFTPTAWFAMLDKLYVRTFGQKWRSAISRVGKMHFWLDQKIPTSSELALRLAGRVLTVIRPTPG